MLRGYDEQSRDRLLQISMTKGIVFRFNALFEKVVKNDDGSLNVHMKGCEPVTCDALLFATGRRPKTDGLGLENAGVELEEKGSIRVDEYRRSTCQRIYAVGDVKIGNASWGEGE